MATTQNIDFSNTQGQKTITLQSEVGSGLNSNSFKILWTSLLLSRIKKIRIKNEGARVATTLNIDFSQSKGQITLQSRLDLAEIRIHSRCYGYLLTSKFEEDPIEIEGARAATSRYIDFSNTQEHNSEILSKFKLIRDDIDVLVTYKNKEYPNKN